MKCGKESHLFLFHCHVFCCPKQNMKSRASSPDPWYQFSYQLHGISTKQLDNNSEILQEKHVEKCEARSNQFGSWHPIKYLSILCKWQDSFHVNSTIIFTESIPQETRINKLGRILCFLSRQLLSKYHEDYIHHLKPPETRSLKENIRFVFYE